MSEGHCNDVHKDQEQYQYHNKLWTNYLKNIEKNDFLPVSRCCVLVLDLKWIH